MKSSWARSQESLAACPWVGHLASQHLHVFPDVSGLMTPITFISQYFCNVKLRKWRPRHFRVLDVRLALVPLLFPSEGQQCQSLAGSKVRTPQKGGDQLSWPYARARHAARRISHLILPRLCVFLSIITTWLMGSCGAEEGNALPGTHPGLPRWGLLVSLALCPASAHHRFRSHSRPPLSPPTSSQPVSLRVNGLVRIPPCMCQIWESFGAGQATHAGVLLSLRGPWLSLPRAPAAPRPRLKVATLRRVYRLLPSHIPPGSSWRSSCSYSWGSSCLGLQTPSSGCPWRCSWRWVRKGIIRACVVGTDWGGCGHQEGGVCPKSPEGQSLERAHPSMSMPAGWWSGTSPGTAMIGGRESLGNHSPQQRELTKQQWRDEGRQVPARSLETESEVIFWKWYIGSSALRKAEKGYRGGWGRN